MNGGFVEVRCPVCGTVIEVRLELVAGLVRSSPRKARYLTHLTQAHPGLSIRARSLIAEDMIRSEKFSEPATEGK